MNIEKHNDKESLTITVSGRVDATTAPEFEKYLVDNIGDTTHLILDLANLEYISSAGLRAILTAQKIMSKQGTMNLINVHYDLMEIFEMTGFAYVLNIETIE